MAITPVIRLYDEKTTNDILKFWFKKNNVEDSEKFCTPIYSEPKTTVKQTIKNN